MNLLNILSTTSEPASDNGGGMESLKKIFTNPIFYAVIGGLVLLIIVVYIIRRFVKATPNAKTIIVRGGRIVKVLDDQTPSYFLVPFRDRVGAVITFNDKEFASDRLFINNGPDALYKINYVLKYKVVDAEKFYPFMDKLNDLLAVKINDELRLFADNGNALTIIKDYRSSENKILEVINKGLSNYSIEAVGFKVNFIEPMAGK